MDTIRMGEDRIKVTLSESELRLYELRCDRLRYDDTGTRKALWAVLDDVKRETGFDAASGRVYIQAYPSRDGSCELFLTLLSEKEKDKSHSDALTLFSPATDKTPDDSPVWYVFPTLSALLACCRCLMAHGYGGESEVRIGEADQNHGVSHAGERFFLSLGFSVPDSTEAILSEFGARRLCGMTALSLGEYSRVLCRKQAVGTLGKLA